VLQEYAGWDYRNFRNFQFAIAPVESMPNIMRYLSLFNPVAHYVAIIRGIMLRGVGLEVLWQNAIVLLFFAVIILSISINKFRRQLV
jgi:ABC-2 type transport system permease protein